MVSIVHIISTCGRCLEVKTRSISERCLEVKTQDISERCLVDLVKGISERCLRCTFDMVCFDVQDRLVLDPRILMSLMVL